MSEKDVLATAHQHALNKAKKKLPVTDATTLIQLSLEVIQNKTSLQDIAVKYGPSVKKAVEVYVTTLSKEVVEKKINEYLVNSDNEKLNELAKDNFSKKLVNTTIKICKIVQDYNEGKIDQEKFMEKLAKSGGIEIVDNILDVYGIDRKQINNFVNEVLSTSSAAVAYAAFTEAYKITMKALEDAELQHEERLRIEDECARSIEMIRASKKQMEDAVNNYFSKYLPAFVDGFEQMDQAIENNDSDGYIKGNLMIQEVLHYKAQFTNQKEFDDLMDSDLDFKL